MTLRATKTSTGTVKINEGVLRIYSDHDLIAVVTLTKAQGHQLIHEINDWLRYPE